jgi:hypothetical protein
MVHHPLLLNAVASIIMTLYVDPKIEQIQLIKPVDGAQAGIFGTINLAIDWDVKLKSL